MPRGGSGWEDDGDREGQLWGGSGVGVGVGGTRPRGNPERPPLKKQQII